MLLRERRGALGILGGVTAALAALDLRSPAVTVLTFGVPLVLTSDILGVRSGAAVHWAQKPVLPLRYFAARVLECAVAAVALVTVGSALLRVLWSVGGLAEADVGAGGITGGDAPLRAAFVVLVVVVMAASSSAWLPRTGRIFAVALVGLTFALDLAAVLDTPVAQGQWFPWIRVLLVPWQSVAVADIGGVVPDTKVGVYAWTVATLGAWAAIGCLGLNRALARGRLARAVES